MDTSIYAAPKADLTLPDEVAGEGLYVVSLHKFLVMFLATMGAYPVYWFYKNWSMYREIERAEGGGDSDIWPVARAIFCIFFVHSLLRKAAAYASSKQRRISDGFVALATVLVILMLLGNVFDRLSWNGIGRPLTDYASFVTLFISAWYFNVARQFINDASGDAAGRTNDSLTWANWIWIVIGLLVWTGSILDLFTTATGTNIE
jgi:hypothetical protein